jgi:hypothetical protein
MSKNQHVARSFERALKAYDINSPVEAMTDLIADAMHLCRQRQFSFDDILTTATMHFDAECEAEAANLPARFDAYEIHGIREFGKGKDRYCEQVPDDEAQFWSLYGHIPGQGVECIGDFTTREHAEEVYARITGRRYGLTPAKEARHA